MNKEVSFKIRGHRADIGDISINRYLPNQYTYHVGHFVFLDHILPFAIKNVRRVNPEAAHPHRGIATLSYILNGEVEHFDSRGNRGAVHSGGVQWMKAGNGIIHNEQMNADSTTKGLLAHGFQFWINLPASIKKEAPDYMSLEAVELPVLQLPGDSGWLKVVVGEYDGKTSKIPTYAQQYLYHINLEPGKKFTLNTAAGLEYAVFLPQHDVTINGTGYYSGDLIGFDNKGGSIEVVNPLETAAGFIIFGGEPYTEPFVAQGPFVMSTREEIQEAHTDYLDGKYGEIVYR